MRVPRAAEPCRTLALISLGSNIDARSNLRAAVARLAALTDVRAVSRVYRTAAVGAHGPEFLNAAVSLETDSDVLTLKRDVLGRIESELGRVRGPDRNAPRTIDLDLAIFGDAVLDVPDGGGGRLRVPDPDLVHHAHIAVPLAEIAPEVRVPGDGRKLLDVAAACVARVDGVFDAGSPL